jgi:hypothetical protein
MLENHNQKTDRKKLLLTIVFYPETNPAVCVSVFITLGYGHAQI